MAITDWDEYIEKIASPHTEVTKFRAATSATAGRIGAVWLAGNAAQDQGAAPTTPAVPTRATTGALGQPNSTTGTLRIPWVQIQAGGQGILILADRLSHMGGLDGTVTTAQTVNTAALTRYTSGVGVWACVEIYTQIGGTATEASVSYTDQDGNTSVTSPLFPIGGAGLREASKLIPIPVASGDYGVQAVATITLSASTTTAGNFGITLYKPLMFFPIHVLANVHEYDSILSTGGNLPEIVDDACLTWLFMAGSGASTGNFSYRVLFSED